MKPTILLVDDDEGFQALVGLAIEKGRLNALFQYLCDGEEAISYLSRKGIFNNQSAFPHPALVLLDLKMPRLNGFEVLQWKLNRPELRELPFVILSSSDLERDKKRASELGARHYLVKPMSLRGSIKMLGTLDRFWHTTGVGSEQIFLRDSETGEYYKSPDGWVANATEATRFDTRGRALEQRTHIPKTKVELLILDQKGRPCFDLRLWADGR